MPIVPSMPSEELEVEPEAEEELEIRPPMPSGPPVLMPSGPPTLVRSDVPEQQGKGYSLDPSLPRIGGLGEIVEVDTCPDNQDGGDYFLDPSRPAIAGRTEVVGYKPCNHEPPTPVVADATNEVPQELQDGGMNLVRGAVDGIKKIGSNVVGTLKNVVERISGSESEDEDMDEYWGEEMVDMEIPIAKVEDDPAILRELAQLEADGMKILTANNL